MADDYVLVEPAAADLLTRAAKGDVQAQSGLVDYCLAKIDSGEGFPSLGYAMAELAARLAAAHGDRLHRRRLAHVLILSTGHAYQVGDFGGGAAHQSEAIAILNELADEGDEQAAQELIGLVESSPPALVAFAGRLTRKAVMRGTTNAAPAATYWSGNAVASSQEG